jgi:hypothetical protein
LSAAADEITRDLAPGSVDVRLRGRDANFVVTPPAVDQPVAESPPPPAIADDGAMTRINVRLPEALKTRIEEAAGHEGLSVNAWLVRAAAAGLEPQRRQEDTRSAGRRYTGWVH